MESIHSSELLELIESDKLDGRLIDVRTPLEYQEGHIKGVAHIDIMSPNFADEISKLPREEKFYMICRSGNRSGSACRYMESIGFQKVVNIEGGMMDWEGETE